MYHPYHTLSFTLIHNVGLPSTILKLRVSCSHTVNILIHTAAQVGSGLDEAQPPFFTLTFLPT